MIDWIKKLFSKKKKYSIFSNPPEDGLSRQYGKLFMTKNGYMLIPIFESIEIEKEYYLQKYNIVVNTKRDLLDKFIKPHLEINRAKLYKRFESGDVSQSLEVFYKLLPKK